MIRGFRSTDTMRWSAWAAADRPINTATSDARSTSGSPRKGPSSACERKSSIISLASLSEIGTSRKQTSLMASANTPPTPNITVIPNTGSLCSPAMNSRLPLIMGATSTCTGPSSTVASDNSSPAAACTAAESTRPRRTRPRSVLCAIESPHSLATTGNPRPAAATTAASGSSTTASGAMGTPWPANRRLDSASESV